MAVIDDLVDRIEDVELKKRIQSELQKLTKQKKFGLVFENHLPECTPLYEIPVAPGRDAAERTGPINEIWTVLQINGDTAVCRGKNGKTMQEFPIDKLVSVASFGDPIYPYLKPIDSICNAPESDLWHSIIEADNYHALQLLEYLYAGRVDCIYIDPPYNTGAKDWKYNNNYVDSKDAYRHSKWLSFMERRLKLAKKLLNPKKSVLVVTIDEKEYLHLGCLLEQIFSESTIQMVTSVINPKGTPKKDYFARVEEYLFFIWIGDAKPSKTTSQFLNSNEEKQVAKPVRWASLQRSGGQSLRIDTKEKFYPIYQERNTGRIIKVGDKVPHNFDISTLQSKHEDVIIQWPVKSDGREGCWQVSDTTLRTYLSQGRVQIGTQNKKTGRWTINYLMSSDWDRIQSGELKVLGKDEFGCLILGNGIKAKHCKTVWNLTSHSATDHGTSLLNKILPDRSFAYPKSLYAVRDTLKLITQENPKALIIDFFAGSGTTLHAVNLLNSEDKGNRRCILITNNEVSEKEAEILSLSGFQPGDKEWDELGIARYITWPRIKCSIEGRDIHNRPLSGSYIGSDRKMSEGFKANVNLFKLGFLDKRLISLGQQFSELLPVLWMKAGSHGPCPKLLDSMEELPEIILYPNNKMAILLSSSSFKDFKAKLSSSKDIETVFIVTDNERSYQFMVSELNVKNAYQLYRDYLDNFRINQNRG